MFKELAKRPEGCKLGTSSAICFEKTLIFEEIIEFIGGAKSNDPLRFQDWTGLWTP
jgi:hypothetical protein